MTVWNLILVQLITFILVLRDLYKEGFPAEDLNKYEWLVIVLFSLVFPAGLIFVILGIKE